MNRQYIDDHQIVAPYLADQLTDDERRAFEAYCLLPQPEMLQELEAAARFKVGLMQLRDAGKIEALLAPQPWYRQVRLIARGLWPLALTLLTVIAHAQGDDNSTTSISSPQAMTVAEFDELFERLSRQTHGRWGKQDQIGALNLVRIEESERALAKRRGRVVPLGRPLVSGRNEEGQTAFELVLDPHATIAGNSDEFFSDSYKIEYHGTLTTHLDGWCHAAYRGRHYNGFRAHSAHSPLGCTPLGLEHMPAVVTRGVLLDIARCDALPYLEPHTSITVAELETCERQLGVRVSSGDAVLVRTGQWARREHLLSAGQWKPPFEFAGLHPAVATWLADRGVAIIGSDAALDRVPSDVPSVNFPLHKLALVALGIPVVDSLYLETLASVAANDEHQWHFALFLAPLRVVGASGGPVNPVAVF